MNERKQYLENVLSYLEYMNYDELTVDFDANDVARSIINCVATFYDMKVSWRLAAISIVGLTYTYQILPMAKKAVKH